VLLFTLAISAAAGLLFGLAPALRLVQPDLHHHLKDAGRGSSGASAIWGRGRNMRRLLVVAELALSVVLLAGAGLLIRSFVRLQDVSPGFDPSNILTFELSMSGRQYSDAGAALETYRQLWERFARLPGVTASGGVSALPLSQMFSWVPITVEGRTPPAGEGFINADLRMAGGDYLRAMRIPLREGRYFTEHDSRTNPRVVIVDEHMAEQLWPGTSPLGRRLRIGGAAATTPWLTVVGVVGRIKQYTLDGDSRIAMYVAQTQFPARAMNVVLRSAGDPAALATAARAQVRSLDPELPIYNVRTMEQRISASLAARRFAMLLLALFAALALGLAAIGIYGVMAYLVSQGTRELGIRIALGATPAGIVMLVVRQGLGVAALGIAAGLAAAFPATRLMQSLLFQVGAADLMTFVTIPMVLGGVALLASYVPARRAARIDPVVSLSAD
jgi:predicted permease